MNSSQLIFAVFGLGTVEIVLIVLVLILLFGAKRIPELLKSIGRGAREFRDAATEKDDYEKTDKTEK